ncbi:unnamed protein product [Rotaria magnacalcarata]|uniref:Uncharacterized protein n=3 Tax=Rotaria magnacalcarata TaxID=392030 RepID=A0A816BT19_9BILA|nr:unnamed protein product [Rotaria magnacalcarata]CAF1615557.1 unnamed protein product [Rotaria magnacalcarata]CAF2036366.1 unnamed protein product [Rotaria magnacalcarata]CAF2152612.1 unnamed protein product [Rotaria magnacalcarata]CAF3817977.1 unnamed protein product [Rotaria magnacalcarata]
MTTTIATPIVSLPKNKTGAFAGDTLQEIKSIKSLTISLSRKSRNADSTTLLLVPTEKSRGKIQQYYTADEKNAMKKEEKSNVSINKDAIRNGFRPSPIRRQKVYDTNSTTHRDLKVSSPKQSLIPSQTSNKLRSEMNQSNRKSKGQADLNKILRGQQNPERIGTPRSNLSYTTTYRVPSACTTSQAADRSHPRFPSSMTTATVNTLSSFSGVIDICGKSTQSLSGISESSRALNEENTNRDELNHHVTHAYQIPQQSNVGSESIFTSHSPTAPFSVKANSKKSFRRSNGPKSVTCPFYVMYFTNLTTQKQPIDNTQKNKSLLSIPTTRVHLATAYSRSNTSYSRYRSAKKRLNTPVTIAANSATDNGDDDETNATLYYNNKRFSAKIAAYENENSALLKDILRTTSWNHVQM